MRTRLPALISPSAPRRGASSGDLAGEVGSFAAGANNLADPGETIAYSLVVANTGDVDVHGVAVTDAKVGTVTCPATTIPVGSSIDVHRVLRRTQADIDAGSVHNTASADSDETSSTESSTTVTLPVRAALHLDKLADHQTFAAAGVLIGYTFTLTNQGNVTLAGPFTVADDQSTNEACPATPATLAPGASITCTASDTTTQQDLNSGALVNTATARATFGSAAVTSNQATATVTATQRPALTLVKTANPTSFTAAGQVIAYTYVATNSGNVTLASPYGVADDRSTDEHCPANPATLAPGATLTCSATYTVTAGDVAAGSVTNRATASARFGAQIVMSNEATATVTPNRSGRADPPHPDNLPDVPRWCDPHLHRGALQRAEGKDRERRARGDVLLRHDHDGGRVHARHAVVTQARSPSLSGWTPMPVQDTGQIVLYDLATCLKSKAQGTTSYVAGTGTATVRVTAPGRCTSWASSTACHLWRGSRSASYCPPSRTPSAGPVVQRRPRSRSVPRSNCSRAGPTELLRHRRSGFACSIDHATSAAHPSLSLTTYLVLTKLLAMTPATAQRLTADERRDAVIAAATVEFARAATPAPRRGDRATGRRLAAVPVPAVRDQEGPVPRHCPELLRAGPGSAFEAGGAAARDAGATPKAILQAMGHTYCEPARGPRPAAPPAPVLRGLRRPGDPAPSSTRN